MERDPQSNESPERHPLVLSPLPFSRNSRISLSEPLKIPRILKAQNKHLFHITLMPYWNSNVKEKALLRFCENNIRNFCWLKRLTFDAKYYSKLTPDQIIQTIKCLKAVQSLTHISLVGRILKDSHLIVPLMKNFKRLQYLTLDLTDYGSLEGFSIFKVFSALKNLISRLRTIKLALGYIWDLNSQIIKELGPAISCLKNLKAISIELAQWVGRPAEGSKVANVASESSEWRVCEPALILNLKPSNEGICKQIFEILIPNFKHLFRLEKVELSFGKGIRIGNQEIERFSKCLPRKLKSLRVNLTKCQSVTKEGILRFLSVIAKLCFLQDISLKFSVLNQIDDEVTKELLRCFNQQKGLESFSLSFEKCNLITESAMTQFLSVLPSNRNLKSLMLCFIGSKKELTDYSLGKLGIAIENLERLEVLVLNFSQSLQITDKGINNLSMRLGNLKKLVLVFRDCINIRGEISEGFFKELEKLNNLEFVILDFKFCKRLDQEEVKKILPCSGNIKYKLLMHNQILSIKKKPYLSNSKLTIKNEHKNTLKLLKAQNKHLLDMNFFFQTSSESSNKTLLKLCDKYPKNLHWLKHLSFHGDFSTKLAIKNILRLWKCLWSARSLTRLDFSGSSLKQVLALAPLFKGLKQLKSLSLDLNDFTQNPLEMYSPPKARKGLRLFTLLKALNGLKDIRIFLQVTGDLPDDTFKKFSTGLSRLKTLNSIDFDLSGFYLLSVKQNFVFDLRALDSLSALTFKLSGINGLKDDILINLAQSLKQVPKLEKLEIDLSNIYSNKIMNRGIETLSSSLPPDLKSLKMNLGSCGEVKQKGIQSLFCSIGRITSLENLSLWLFLPKELVNEGLLSLNLCLSGLKFLKSLGISFMHNGKAFEIHDLVLDEFLYVLASKTVLKSLSLRFPSSESYSVDGKRLEKFGDLFMNLKRLKNLELSFKGFRFDPFHALLERFADKLKSFGKLQTLELDFSYCELISVKVLEGFIKNLKELKDLRKATLNFESCFGLNMQEVEKILPNPKSLHFQLSVLYENIKKDLLEM